LAGGDDADSLAVAFVDSGAGGAFRAGHGHLPMMAGTRGRNPRW
jgi:hypothetical protein